MRRTRVAAVAVLLCLLCFFSTCAVPGAETFARRADRLVSAWDEAALNLYRYSGRELEYGGRAGYMLVMTPESGLFASQGALREYQKRETVRQCVGTVYRDLSQCFAGAEQEVCIIIAVCGGDGKLLFTFLNGDIL